MEDRGPWMHDMIVEGNSEKHQGWSYWVLVMKRGQVIMWNMRDIRHTPVTVEQYLQDQFETMTQETAVMSLMVHTYNGSDNGHSADRMNTKTICEPWQDKAGVDNPTVTRVENQAQTKTQTYHKVSLIVGQK